MFPSFVEVQNRKTDLSKKVPKTKLSGNLWLLRGPEPNHVSFERLRGQVMHSGVCVGMQGYPS